MADIEQQIEHAALRRLYRYWLEKRRGRSMPAPGDIDPLELKFVLGNLILVDVEQPSGKFRVRLYGSNLAQRMGYDITGKYMDEHPLPAFAESVTRRFARVAQSAQPLAERAEFFVEGRAHRFDGLILPLSADGESVDRLLVGVMRDT